MPSVLIVDDSPTARNVLAAVLSADPAIDILGFAENGQQAIDLTRSLSPDVITMDINMPVMNGLQATKEIMIETPTPIIVVSSTGRIDEVEWSMQALRAGALTAIKKPSGPDAPDFVALCKEIVHTVKAMAGIYVIRHRRAPAETVVPHAPSQPAFDAAKSSLRAVAIAASTGGPPALGTLLGALPSSFPAPILLVQHIVPSFVEGFVAWLDSVVDVKVKLAVHHQRVEPGTVYVAPPDRHLGMSSPTRLELSDKPAVDGFRPAATHLFGSLADSVGGEVAAVIMTGMGSDGVPGLKRVHDAGGYTIAQDEQSCVVFGMPQAAITAGVIDATLPLESIANELERLAQK
jgi:two-component system chemotaxis response regulator CheB